MQVTAGGGMAVNRVPWLDPMANAPPHPPQGLL